MVKLAKSTTNASMAFATIIKNALSVLIIAKTERLALTASNASQGIAGAIDAQIIPKRTHANHHRDSAHFLSRGEENVSTSATTRPIAELAINNATAIRKDV